MYVEYFLTMIGGVSTEDVARLRNEPSWLVLEAEIQTVVYDGIVVRDTWASNPLAGRRP